MHRWLNKLWYPGAQGSFGLVAARFALLPLSWVFALLSGLRRAAYRSGIFSSAVLPVPVIVVGNLSVGGTGKTPLVLWLVQALTTRGWHPGIVTRGYGGAARMPHMVTSGSDPAVVGDEPVLSARRSGVAVCAGRERVAAGRYLLAQSSSQSIDIIVSDDGLQHYALHRDAEIVVIDATRGFGNGSLLPAGPLRESPGRLRGVAAVVLNGAAASDASALREMLRASAPQSLQLAMQLHCSDVRPVCGDGTAQTLAAFAGRTVHAVAGIGHPQRFFSLLRAAGLTIVEHAFPDHHAWQPGDLAFADALPVLMTEKDAVKCSAFADARLFAVAVDAVLAEADAAALFARILPLLRSQPGTH